MRMDSFGLAYIFDTTETMGYRQCTTNTPILLSPTESTRTSLKDTIMYMYTSDVNFVKVMGCSQYVTSPPDVMITHLHSRLSSEIAGDEAGCYGTHEERHTHQDVGRKYAMLVFNRPHPDSQNNTKYLNVDA